VAIARCAATECDTPNDGPIWRIVRFDQHVVSACRPAADTVSGIANPHNVLVAR
jgi:hypothetical protein